MNRRVKISIICIMLVLCVSALALFFNADRFFSCKIFKDTFHEVSSDFSNAYARINLKSNEQFVKTYTSDSGEKYLFLPALVSKFQFENLDNSLSLSINGESLEYDALINVSADFDILLIKDGLQVDKISVMRSENIGTMFIDSEYPQEKIDETNGERFDANCVLWDSDGDIPANSKLSYIRTRGNSTFNNTLKKSYEIKFVSDVSLYNDVHTSEWILLANAFDDTLIKNRLVFEFAQKYIDIGAPVGDFVDLYINGEYRGNYYLCNKAHESGEVIDIVDLDELNKQVNTQYDATDLEYGYNDDETAFGVTNLDSYSDVTGGYIIELTPKEQIKPTDAWFKTNSGFIGKLRAPKYATLEEVEYIQNYFNELEAAALNDEGINPETGKAISDYLDVDSYVTRYFVDLAFANADSSLASSFFYKNVDSIDSKIYCGPLWDYDQSIYDAGYYEDINVDRLGANYLCNELMLHEEISTAMQETYEKYRDVIRCEMPAILYEENNRIEKSRAINNIRWDKKAINSHFLIDNTVRYFDTRLKVIDERVLHEDPYCSLSFYDSEGRLLTTKEVRYGECLDDIPIVTSWTGIFAGWYNIETDKLFTTRTKVYKDGSYRSAWLSVDLLVQNGIDATGVDVNNVNIQELEAIVEDIKAKQEKNDE